MARFAFVPVDRSAASWRWRGMVTALLAAAADVAQAQSPARDVSNKLPAHPVEAPVRTIGSTSTPPIGEPCVTVDIGGYKAGDRECAAQELEAAARSAQRRARAAVNLVVPGAQSADVVTGVANQTATRQRMGNTYGAGVQPQRPGPVPVPPRLPQP